MADAKEELNNPATFVSSQPSSSFDWGNLIGNVFGDATHAADSYFASNASVQIAQAQALQAQSAASLPALIGQLMPLLMIGGLFIVAFKVFSGGKKAS